MSALLASLDPEERAALVVMLAPGSGWTTIDISRALIEEGHDVKTKQVQPCRAGQCTHCPNEEWLDVAG